VSIFQRLNGYKPFLYNVTVDACKFYKNQKSNPVAGYIYSLLRSYSNMNHSCPYDVSLITTPILQIFVRIPCLIAARCYVGQTQHQFSTYKTNRGSSISPWRLSFSFQLVCLRY